jgi:hypothetical protein
VKKGRWGYGYTYLDDDDIVLTRGELLAKPAAWVLSFTQRYFINDSNLFYRPLVNLSFVIDAGLAGNQPFVYHLTKLYGQLTATGWIRHLYPSDS